MTKIVTGSRRANRSAHIFYFFIFTFLLTGMTTYTTDEALYKVVKLDRPMKIDANWDKEQWKNVIPVKIEKHMGDLPKFEPQVEAKMMYDQKNVYGIFRVKDRFVQSTVQ
jgi:hypothetical protein